MNYIFIFILLLISSIVYLKIAKRLGIIDIPNHRSSHKEITVRGGGILFYIALIIYFGFIGELNNYFFIGVTLIASISFIDDFRPLSPGIRFPFQIISVALALIEVQLDFPIYLLIIFLIAGVAFLNAFNFMDGINGITGMYGLTLIGGFYILNNFYESFISNDFLVYIFLSLLVFGFFNFRKRAIFFAGDVGSISLAMIILYLSYYFIQISHSPLVLLLVAVYGIDSLMTILLRLKLGESIFQAHRHHIYQKLVDYDILPHLGVAFLYALLQAIFIILVIFCLDYSIQLQWIMTIIGILSLSLLYVYSFNFLRKKIKPS